MIGYGEIAQNAEREERKILSCKSIPKLKQVLIDYANNIKIPYNKELLIDIIIDMKRENWEIPF